MLKKLLGALVLTVALAGFGGCENPWMKDAVAPLYKNKGGGNNDNGGVGGYPFTTPAEYRTTVSLSGGTITGHAAYNADDGDTLFPSGRNVTLSPFHIAKYETTYELWYEVKTWAAGNGYTFANLGREGHDGNPGDFPTPANTEPVTCISWRDTVVWCNAYSEMSGKEPVYYTDDAYTAVLKTSSSADSTKMNPGANGYRLPTEAEREYAARGGGTPLPSGSFVYTYAGSNTVEDVAWYRVNSYDVGSGHADYGTHPVGTKAGNSAQLYNMSGNVWEWCWDWLATISPGFPEFDPAGPSSGSFRVFRGGGWHAPASDCEVAHRGSDYPSYQENDLGFRVVSR